MAGFQVELRSKEQILGDLIRAILAHTDINDVSVGSDLSLMLEAIATSMFQISLGALKILENTNLESLVGNALDKKAESLQLPNTLGGIGRIPAAQSSGIVTIGSPFTKISTKFYAGKPSPFAGSKTIYLESASGFDTATNKKLYIGRKTADRFEGPIPYVSATNMGSFWVIKLASPLTKNHLYSDIVVLAQGGDRSVAAGLVVHTTASNEVPAVGFTVTGATVLPDGESEVDVAVSCQQFGEAGNALAGSIREFSNAPFFGATVTNQSALKNGRSTESDEDLRKRIKNYPATLSRGTSAAITAAIQGISDPDTGRTITSSVIVEPTEPGDFSRVYINDGSGLEPTFDVQPYELLLQSASGQETKFQTAKFPITPATAIGSESGPFVVEAGQSLTVVIDGISETYTITTANYSNLNAATAYELVRDFNSQSNIVGFRTLDGGKRIVMSDLAGSAETLQVSSGDLQQMLGFPTSVIRPIFVYRNSEIQSFKGRTATLVSNPFSSWNPAPADFFEVPFIVDDVTQIITITSNDFVQFQSDMSSATISQWATVFGQKIAGASFEVAGNYLICTTRQTTSPSGSLQIPETRLDGSVVGWVGDAKMWLPPSNGGILHSIGSNKDFQFNRFTGEMRFLEKPAVGATIEIGSRKTRATIKSFESPTGLFGLTPFSTTLGNAKIVVAFDGECAIRTVGVATSDRFYPSVPDAINAPNIIRLFANNKYTFGNAQVGDYMFLVKDIGANAGWGSKVEGMYKLKSVGFNFTPTNITYSTISASVTNGSSIVTVTMTDHGFQTGARVTIVTASAIGGISALNLSKVNVMVTVSNSNIFTYDAVAVGTGGTGTLDSVIYLADTWAEIEVSQDQMPDWAPLLSAYQNITVGMISIFKCDGAIPQIVDFGAVGSVTTDGVIGIINSQISCGQAIKISGKQFGIMSNDWANGTAAVLAVLSSAANMIAVGTASSMQSHTAYSTSQYAQGGVPISTIQNQTDLRPTGVSIYLDKDLTDIVTLGSEPTVEAPSIVTNYPKGFETVWVTGRQAGLTGRIYNNQSTSPFTGILRTTGAIPPLETSDTYQTLSGTLDRYSNYSVRLTDMPIAADDRLVVEMDLDPINKTVAIPLFKSALIQDIDAISGSGAGQVISFRLKDPDDTYDDDSNIATPEVPRPFFHAESVYKSFDFKDFKILTRNVGLYRAATTLGLSAIGYLTPLAASAVSGIQDGDTFTLNDGIISKTFEFDDNGSLTNLAHIQVPFVAGNFAIGSLTAIAMLPGTSLDEGDTFTLNDGSNPAVTFEFDSDNSVITGNVAIPYVHAVKSSGSLTSFLADPTAGIKDGDTFVLSDGATTITFEFDTPAYGSLTAVAANAATGIKDGDTFTLGDGVTTKVFEFDTNSSVSGPNIPVTIGATDGSLLVKAAIILAITSSGLTIAATSGSGNVINLNNSVHGAGGNVTILESFGNFGVTLSHVGMLGGGVTVGHTAVNILSSYSSSLVRSAIITAIVATALNITAVPGSGDTILLNNTNWGATGNVIITETFVNFGVTLYPVGMAGGVDNATAATIKSLMISAISAYSPLNITATSGAGNLVNLANNYNGISGNQTIAESIASPATLSPVGMAGGINDSSAEDLTTAMVAAINGVTFNIKAAASASTGIVLANQIIGAAGNQSITESIASGATLAPLGMNGGSNAAISGDNALVVRSAAYGATARTRIALLLPSEPNQGAIQVSHLNNFENGVAQCNIMVTLASQATIAGSILNTGNYSVNAVASGSLTLLTFTAAGLNSAGQYQPGNVLRIGGISGISGAYFIVFAMAGKVSVLAPCAGDLISLTSMSATSNPLSSYQLVNKNFSDIATAINAYLIANPVASGAALGAILNPMLLPTYVSNPASTPYTGTVMSLAFIHHSFECKLSGSAGIWSYDSSVPSLNAIKATVQTEDSVFPTATEAAGTTYSPINESVVIVPSNSQTLQRWMNFNATSSLTILAETLPIQSANLIQIVSRADGSEGAVKVTGVTGNSISSFVSSNATDEGYATKLKILSADAKSLLRGQLVLISNGVATEILRPYRTIPTGDSITTSNTTSINTYFRGTNSVKYIKLSTNEARLVFYRYGQGPGQSEPLTAVTTTITLSVPSGLTLADGIIRVTSNNTNLAARVGDMMYVKSSSAFPADVKCTGLGSSGVTDPLKPEYWGYPVVRVVNAGVIDILAPNITSLGATVLASSTDLVFLPAIYNEKNILSNRQPGAKFNQTYNNGAFNFLIKSLGGNLVSLWLQNSATEATDTMLLKEVQVNTDDFITLSEGFDSSNQGTFKIIAHNGRNQVLFYNPNGGKDEVIDKTSITVGGKGQRIWRVGPITENTRSIRIVDGESVQLGERLRISTPVTSSAWFPASMIGSWRISGMGYIGITQATGQITAIAANPATGIKDGDTFTLGDGNRVLVFEFDTNSSLLNSNHIQVPIGTNDSAITVAVAITSAINGLSSDFGITAANQSAIVTLLNRRIDISSDYPITEGLANYVPITNPITLSPVGMVGSGVSDGALTPYIDIAFPGAIADLYSSNTALPVDKFLISGNDSSIGFVEEIPYSGFRIVGGHAVDPQSSELSNLFLTPRIQTSKMSETFGTKITGLFKIGFEERAFQGIDGYKVFAGLVREAHRVIDGLPTNTILYPGTKAMGAAVEVEPPLVKTVQMSLSVRPKDGVTINSISEIIKSTVAGYINALGVGKPVVISEIVRLVQGLPGVYSVTVTSTKPAVTDDRIVISDIESASVHNVDTDISVG